MPRDAPKNLANCDKLQKTSYLVESWLFPWIYVFSHYFVTPLVDIRWTLQLWLRRTATFILVRVLEIQTSEGKDRSLRQLLILFSIMLFRMMTKTRPTLSALILIWKVRQINKTWKLTRKAMKLFVTRKDHYIGEWKRNHESWIIVTKLVRIMNNQTLRLARVTIRLDRNWKSSLKTLWNQGFYEPKSSYSTKQSWEFSLPGGKPVDHLHVKPRRWTLRTTY